MLTWCPSSSIVTSSASDTAVHHGPTWERESDGSWKLPKYTLGWSVLGWTAKYLRQPDGPDAGSAWTYTPEQARWILWWYAIDERGRFIYQSGMLRRPKGWGKDPIAATVCATEFIGPCRFGGWDDAGEPIAVSHKAGWVLIAAVSLLQTRTTMSLFPSLFSDEAIAEYRIDLGKEIIYANHGRSRIEAVTSSPRALEGPRTTFTLKNETQHWLANNDGHAMARVITRNAVKARDGASRRLALSNAHQPGEDSDAEHDWEAYQLEQQGRARVSGNFMYDSLEAPADLDISDEDALRRALRAVRGDSTWLDVDGHVQTIYDQRNAVSDSRRFYLNQLVAAEDAWVAPHEWDQLAEPADIAEGEQITMGLDPSKTGDHTVLMGCRVSDGYTFTLGAWDPQEYGGEAPRDIIDDTVQRAFTLYEVVAFFSDLHPFESYVDRWSEEHGRALRVKASPRHAIAWDMRGKRKESTVEYERLHDEIVEGAFQHDGHPLVRQHVHNARRRPNAWGVSVGKEHRMSDRKIDAVPSIMLARHARRRYLDSGKRRRRRSGKTMVV